MANKYGHKPTFRLDNFLVHNRRLVLQGKVEKIGLGHLLFVLELVFRKIILVQYTSDVQSTTQIFEQIDGWYLLGLHILLQHLDIANLLFGLKVVRLHIRGTIFEEADDTVYVFRLVFELFDETGRYRRVRWTGTRLRSY